MSLTSQGMTLQPTLAWQFEGTTTDYMTGVTGTTTGSPTYVPGQYGNAINFPNTTNTGTVQATNYII